MNYCERILEKTQLLFIDDENIRIDTEGMEAVVKAIDGEVYIKANTQTNNDNAFMLDAGESITLNGSFYLSGDGVEIRIMYCRII